MKCNKIKNNKGQKKLEKLKNKKQEKIFRPGKKYLRKEERKEIKQDQNFSGDGSIIHMIK